jgi:hypothetical protein
VKFPEMHLITHEKKSLRHLSYTAVRGTQSRCG